MEPEVADTPNMDKELMGSPVVFVEMIPAVRQVFEKVVSFCHLRIQTN